MKELVNHEEEHPPLDQHSGAFKPASGAVDEEVRSCDEKRPAEESPRPGGKPGQHEYNKAVNAYPEERFCAGFALVVDELLVLKHKVTQDMGDHEDDKKGVLHIGIS